MSVANMLSWLENRPDIESLRAAVHRSPASGCTAGNIPADATIAENGVGQFEVNLLHVVCKQQEPAVYVGRVTDFERQVTWRQFDVCDSQRLRW